jgi:hypothetical protein
MNMARSSPLLLLLFLSLPVSFVTASIALADTPSDKAIIFGSCQAGTTCVNFDWPDVPGAAYYRWEYRKDYETWPVGSDHQMYFAGSQLRDCYAEQGCKFWRVTAFDSNDEVILVSGESEFCVNHCTPHVVGPCNELILRDNAPDTICVPFTWTAVAYGLGYYVWEYRENGDPWGLPGTSVPGMDPEHRDCFSEFGTKDWRFWVYDQAGNPAFVSDECYICLQCSSPAEQTAWGSVKELWR